MNSTLWHGLPPVCKLLQRFFTCFSVADSPDGEVLYSGGYDCRLVYWPAAADKPEPYQSGFLTMPDADVAIADVDVSLDCSGNALFSAEVIMTWQTWYGQGMPNETQDILYFWIKYEHLRDGQVIHSFQTLPYVVNPYEGGYSTVCAVYEPVLCPQSGPAHIQFGAYVGGRSSFLGTIGAGPICYDVYGSPHQTCELKATRNLWPMTRKQLELQIGDQVRVRAGYSDDFFCASRPQTQCQPSLIADWNHSNDVMTIVVPPYLIP